MTDLAYAAGFFDGEGCIHMRENGQISVSLFQKDSRPLLYIQQTTGFGRFRKHRNDYWLKTTRPAIAVPFLKSILPFLILKKEQAEITIKFFESRRGDYLHDAPARQICYERLKALKKERQ